MATWTYKAHVFRLWGCALMEKNAYLCIIDMVNLNSYIKHFVDDETKVIGIASPRWNDYMVGERLYGTE